MVSSHDSAEMLERNIEKYRKNKVGCIYRPMMANTVATKDAIRHFADAIGDPNPLWRSEDYAGRSIYGCIIAPPCFLNAISEGQAIQGLPGLITTFVGAEWEWYKIIRVNDRFTVTNLLYDLEDKGNEKDNIRILQSGLLSYFNQEGKLVGTCKWHMMRSQKALGGGKDSVNDQLRDKDRKVYKYSEQELESIYEAIDSEEVRGSNPRYWEDVKVGDELKPVVKGPFSISDMIAWAIGISWPRIALGSGEKIKFLRDNPGLSYVDPNTGVPEPIANSHFLDSAAKILMGSPYIFDLGMHRLSCLGHLVTNWISDHGFLEELGGRIEKFVRYGDTVWYKGKVARKYNEKGKYFVEIDLRCENQLGEVVTPGRATVSLPAKSVGLTSVASHK